MKKATLCYIRRIKPGAKTAAGCETPGGWEYLMLYRNKKKDDPNEGKWIGVGGKIEPGETPDECMLREVKEETGIELTDYHFCGVIHFISDTWEDEDMYLYRAELTGPGGDYGSCSDGPDEKPIRCDEGELRWIPEEQMMSLPMWEGDRLFLEPLMKGAGEINMTLRYEGEKLM